MGKRYDNGKLYKVVCSAEIEEVAYKGDTNIYLNVIREAGLKEFIADNLNVTAEIFNPFQRILNNNVIENPAQYAVSIGLALRGLKDK